MELRVAIVALACFSCLLPPALGHPILAAKALAAKKAALVGAGVLAAKGALVAKGALIAKGAIAAKGAALKGAALLAKGTAAKGAALLAAKGAAIKGAAALGGALLASKVHVHRPLMVKPVVVPYKPCETPAVVPVAPTVVVSRVPTLGDKLSSLLGLAQSSVEAKSKGISDLLGALREKVKPRPVVYEVVTQPKLFPVPLIEKVDILYK